MFSFTSTRGKIHHFINSSAGLYAFVLYGQNYHRIGSLLPPEGSKPMYSQLYIHDTDNEINNLILVVRYTASIIILLPVKHIFIAL